MGWYDLWILSMAIDTEELMATCFRSLTPLLFALSTALICACRISHFQLTFRKPSLYKKSLIWFLVKFST